MKSPRDTNFVLMQKLMNTNSTSFIVIFASNEFHMTST